MARDPPDTVLDAKLKTEFLSRCVRHTRYIPGSSSRERRIQVKESWYPEVVLGRGSYGVVRRESCRTTSTPTLELPYRVRAVKEISKTLSDGKTFDYMKELEAINKFSHSRYAAYFVRTYGWYENIDSVFITMEYFPLGDLQKFMSASPSFSEEVTRQIVRQLLEGLDIMHANGFAHRDMKPGNILVESNFPEWLVKITDFGISKRAREGETELRSFVGTPGYAAPEVQGYFSGNDVSIPYSVTIDIWAIGVITFALLMKRLPFPSTSDFASYVSNSKQLDLDSVASVNLSDNCRDFVSGLLSANPATRPTAGSAVAHRWIMSGILPIDAEKSLFIDDEPRGSYLQAMDAPTPASTALPFSNLHLTDAPPTTESTGTRLSTYRGPRFNTSVLTSRFRDIPLEEAKYFILRSTNELDIETSVALGIWTSSKRVKKILDKGFARANHRVILFFSVIKSRKFCGVAQMTSVIDWVNTDEDWVEDVWEGRFTLNWLNLTEISFDKVKHIPVSQKSPGYRAVACYDGTEISAESAYELLKAVTSEKQEHQYTDQVNWRSSEQ